ncbi:MAG TPA: DNA polymerase III subunit gamma/tau [Acidimicrobiia bacterium]|nr:DNA polymerase III subunit gamma/tau [Acidimicrobiia bacterium]
MASHSLYRKYRPQRFSELVGQEHVTTALRNAVTDDKIGHAYLFSGPRGTGKTTTARLLARALNCLDLGTDGEPCGKCENCDAVASGTFYDLVELDAASNNGVDAMRELISNVHLGIGASSRRKVYVLDEVHMLSAASSNTLLKTLEEPPAHVVFVLATTDPQKVLPTIRSRTQHFEFTLMSQPDLVALLTNILQQEGVEADPDALELVAIRAAGSARDALSILDQALAVGGGRIDAEQVQSAFGGAPFALRLAVLQAAAHEDVAGALVALHELLGAGHDVRRATDDLLGTLRDAFMQANAAGRVPYDGPAPDAEQLAALAQEMGNPAIVRAIEIFGQAIIDIRGQTVPDPRLVLEVAVVRITRREARTREETLLDRVERLEQKLANGVPAAAAAPTPAAPARPAPKEGGPLLARRERAPKAAPAEEAAPTPAPETEAPAPPPAPPAAEFMLDDVIAAWPGVLGELSTPVRAAVQEAQPLVIEDGAIVFGLPKAHEKRIKDKFRQEAPAIKAAFAQRLGSEPMFKLKIHDFDAQDAFRNEPEPPPPPAEPEFEEDDVEGATPAKNVDAPPDSAARLADAFGAEIVEERPRT